MAKKTKEREKTFTVSWTLKVTEKQDKKFSRKAKDIGVTKAEFIRSAMRHYYEYMND